MEDELIRLIRLAQERNTLALESLGELREIHRTLKEIEREQDEQTELLRKLVPQTPPVPGPLKRAVLIFGSAQ